MVLNSKLSSQTSPQVFILSHTTDSVMFFPLNTKQKYFHVFRHALFLVIGLVSLVGIAALSQPASAGLFGGEKQWAGVRTETTWLCEIHTELKMIRVGGGRCVPL